MKHCYQFVWNIATLAITIVMHKANEISVQYILHYPNSSGQDQGVQISEFV